MIWQDMVMGLCTVGFAAALVPQVLHGMRERHTTVQMVTAGANALLVGVVAFCSASLGLWTYGAVNVLTAVLWAVLAWQAWRWG
jgi:uncharacterized membrane protein